MAGVPTSAPRALRELPRGAFEDLTDADRGVQSGVDPLGHWQKRTKQHGA